MVTTRRDVSVVVPMYNAAGTIERALKTVVQQSVVDWELIVVDDGSSDASRDIVREKFPHATLICQNNMGAAAARNRGVSVATAPLIAFLDADDQWHRRKLEVQLGAMKGHPRAGMCSTRLQRFRVGEEGEYRADCPLPQLVPVCELPFLELFQKPYLSTPTILIEKSLFDECGGFDESLKSAEDVDLWLRAGYRQPVIMVESILVGVSHTPGGLSDSRRRSIDLDNLRVIEKFANQHPDFVASHPQAIRAGKAEVLARLGSELLCNKEYGAARRALAKSLLNAPSWRAFYLFAKTLLPIG